MEMQLAERMTGSSKSSYQKVGNCKVIVRHKNKIDPEKIGARGRNIDRIFIETKDGERFMFPNKDLMSARAMSRHMSNGGLMEDDIGNYIMRLSEECHDLARVAHHVSYNKHRLDESALELRGKVRSRLNEIRHTLNRMSKPHGYDMQVNTLNESGFGSEEYDEDTLNEEVEQLAKTLGVNDDDKLKEALGSAAKVKLREQNDNEQELQKAVEAGNVAGALDALGLKMNPKDFEGKEQEALLAFLGAYGTFGVERGSQKELKDAVQQLANNSVQMLPETGEDEDEPEQFKDKYARLGFRLGQKAPRIKNDLLSNLASRVSYKLSHRGQTGVDPVTKQEAQVTNMILKGIREGGVSESLEESAPLRESRDLANWFENYDATKIFENRKKKELNESVKDWFDWAEVTDTSELTEDEVWNFTAQMVTNAQKPDQLREMYNQLSTTDQKRVMENLEETWVPELQTRVKKALGEAEEEDDGPIEAYGVKGANSKSWRKEFKSVEALNKWADKNDAEVHGTRKLNENKRTKSNKRQLNESWPMRAAMGAASTLVGGSDDDLEEDEYDMGMETSIRGQGELDTDFSDIEAYDEFGDFDYEGEDPDQIFTDFDEPEYETGLGEEENPHETDKGDDAEEWEWDTDDPDDLIQRDYDNPDQAYESAQNSAQYLMKKYAGLLENDGEDNNTSTEEESSEEMQVESTDAENAVLEVWNKMNGYQTSPKKSLNEFTDEEYDDLDSDDEELSREEGVPTGDMFDDFVQEIEHPDNEKIHQGDYGMGDESGYSSPVGSKDMGPHHYFREEDEYEVPDAGDIDDTFMQDEEGDTVQKRLYYGDPEKDKSRDNDDGLDPLFPYSSKDFVKHGDDNDK